MDVILLEPRGYCYGVQRALDMVSKAAKDSATPKPIYVLGAVVHNRHVSEMLAKDGIITLASPGKTRLELLENIEEGTVVFTAHGIGEAVRARARERGLHTIDATCPDVERSFSDIRRYIADDNIVLFIGRQGHPESEAACSISERVRLIQHAGDIHALPAFDNQIAVVSQTTMSDLDINPLLQSIKARFPEAINDASACLATQSRQEAVLNQPENIEHCIVVGDINSHNTRKLVELSIARGIAATRVDGADDLPLESLKRLRRVSVTSGASTPETVAQRVVERLKSL